MKNALLCVLLLPLFGCTDLLSAGGRKDLLQLGASWTGGASGGPNDRTETEPVNDNGTLMGIN